MAKTPSTWTSSQRFRTANRGKPSGTSPNGAGKAKRPFAANPRAPNKPLLIASIVLFAIWLIALAALALLG